MKRIQLIIALLLPLFLTAQDGIRYQGVAFDRAGDVSTDSQIALLLTIRSGSFNGTDVYQERHALTTDRNGLFVAIIGQGEVISGDWPTIVWESNAHFLNVNLDPDGGSDYIDVGTSEFLAVPYAFHATTALRGPDGPQGPSGAMGVEGDQGPRGVKGPTGPQAPKGAAGPRGQKGDPGPSGPQGAVGPEGPRGATGAEGPQGLQGPKGFVGPQGPQGIPGPTGPQGFPGAKGPTGPQGPEQGETGPMGPQGPSGDPNGPKGPPGPQGPQGPIGPSGALQIAPIGPPGQGFQQVLSTPPSNPALNTIYLDNGSNRQDGQLGFRYYNGSFWIDLF